MAPLADVAAIALAYLVGAIPFAYLIVYIVRRVDIRTLGSGNVGATNAGRLLGFRYFAPIFALDLLKGLLPTLVLPALVRRAGFPAGGLDVAVALAAILGHNFPIYLRFRGGKGVATSLGALIALDPSASAAMVAAAAVFLVVTRYVSMASVGGGLVFVVVHFARVDSPWSPPERAMSALTLLLLGMVIVRHRANFARIRSGTEPRVRFGRRRGNIRAPLLIGVLLAGGVAVALARHATRPNVAQVGPFRLAEVDRVATGHQRAGRLAFADGGKRLVVTCPRYNRLMIYRVTDDRRLDLEHDVELEGRPVAVAPSGGRLYVLQRPEGDRRHVEPGFWQAYLPDGKPIGERVEVGYYPDDLAILGDDRVLVVASGSAEGGEHRAPPSLEVYEIGGRRLADVRLGGAADDPQRLIVSGRSTHAAVVLGDGSTVGVDLSDPSRPSVSGRVAAVGDLPWISRSGDESMVMAARGEACRLGNGPYMLDAPGEESSLRVVESPPAPRGPVVAGMLPLRGPANFGTVRPTALAYSADRGLAAVANRSGGVHLIEILRR